MKHKNLYIQGLVVFLALLLLLVLIFWLSNSDLPFASSYRLEVKFDSAGGLLDQAKVLMRGYRIGSVKSVRFEPDGIVIILSINKKFRIPAGSEFAVVNYNFIGERAVGITPAPSGEDLPPNAQIRGESHDIMTEAQFLVSELRKRLAGSGAANIEKLASQLEKSIGSIMQKLNASDSAIVRILQDKEFLELAKVTLKKINAILDELKINPDKYLKQSLF